MSKNYAVIDIGTLKVKFLVARVNSGVGIEKLYSSSTLTCFGCDMVDGNIVDGYLIVPSQNSSVASKQC